MVDVSITPKWYCILTADGVVSRYSRESLVWVCCRVTSALLAVLNPSHKRPCSSTRQSSCSISFLPLLVTSAATSWSCVSITNSPFKHLLPCRCPPSSRHLHESWVFWHLPVGTSKKEIYFFVQVIPFLNSLGCTLLLSWERSVLDVLEFLARGVIQRVEYPFLKEQ